jgi:MFS family permease
VLPLLAKITFDSGPEVYSWMSIAMGAGAMIGALFAANRSDVRGKLLYGTGMVFGVSILVAALAPTLTLFIALLVVVGGGQIAFLATTNSALQLISDPSMRGRVMAVYTITLLGTTPIGGPLVGWISDAFGPRWGFAIGGIATVIGVLVFGTAFVRARHAQAEADHPDGIVLGVDGEAIPASVS